jgi:hypothetical protein
MSITFPILGALGLIFRIWLTQFKLAEELQFRKDYASRWVNYYFFIGMILDFQDQTFNLIIAGALPLMLISFVGWDTLFFWKFKSRTYWPNVKNHKWLLIERLTMHPPMIVVGLLWYFMGLRNYLTMNILEAIVPTIICAIMIIGPELLWDERLTKKYIAPTGQNIFVMTIISIVWMLIFMAFF